MLIFLCGCVTASFPVDDRKAAKIIPGQTTKAQLLELCGKPDTSGFFASTNGRFETLTWIYQPRSEAAEMILGTKSRRAHAIHVRLGTNGIVDSVEIENASTVRPNP